MNRRLLAVLILAGSLVAVALPAPAETRAPNAASELIECTVYVTRTGSKYHRPTCSSLRYGRRAMARSEALAAGYLACKRCGGASCE